MVSDKQSGGYIDRETDPGGDLAYIRYLMEEAQRSTTISGPLLVIWGALDGFGYLAQWWIERYHVNDARTSFMWVVALLAGCALAYRQKRLQVAWSPAGRAIIALWIASWISICLVYFVGGLASPINKTTFPGIEAAIIAIPVFVTGLIAKASWLRNLGLLWWMASALMLGVPGSYCYLLIAALYFSLFVVPGLLLSIRAHSTPEAV